MAKRNDVDKVEDSASGLTAFETKLVNLLALSLVQERTQSEQIALLNRAGFRPFEIAALLGTTSNTVRVQLSTQKHAKKRSEKRPAKRRRN